MIILLCGCNQCGLNAHSVNPDSMRIESWSSVDRPLHSLYFVDTVIYTCSDYDIHTNP